MLEGLDLGVPAAEPKALRVGSFPSPVRPTFAVGQLHIQIGDVEEYERLRELTSSAPLRSEPS